MAAEYRMVFVASFGTAAERDKACDLLKTQFIAVANKAAGTRRADITKDEYSVVDPTVTGYEAFLIS